MLIKVLFDLQPILNFYILIFFKISLIILQKTLQIQESASSSLKNGVNYHNTKVLKDLVDKQWKEGGQFMIDEAQKFDSKTLFNIINYVVILNCVILIIKNIVASLLTCLYELKSENIELEDELDAVRRHRDKLLAENKQYKTPTFDYSFQHRYQNRLTPNGYMIYLQ